MFTLTTDDKLDNPSITLFHDNEEYTLQGVSSFKVNYSTKGRGKGKGTKVILSIMSPIIRNGVSDCRVETYELPKDLERVIELSKFWEDVPHSVSRDTSKSSKTSINIK